MPAHSPSSSKMPGVFLGAKMLSAFLEDAGCSPRLSAKMAGAFLAKNGVMRSSVTISKYSLDPAGCNDSSPPEQEP